MAVYAPRWAPRCASHTSSSSYCCQEHKEYWPLVARRAHALGGRPSIEDKGLRDGWESVLGSLARQPAPPPAERLKAAVLLLAQARHMRAFVRLWASVLLVQNAPSFMHLLFNPKKRERHYA